MKTNREEIIDVSAKLFAQKGYSAVSTSMIADEIGITKGALYRHFENKQAILDGIIEKMFRLDEERANEDGVPAQEFEQDADGYMNTRLSDFCKFVVNQFDFWTKEGFVSDFRKMITIEQYTNLYMNKLYQDVIALGPVKYSEDLFREMINNGQMNDEAARFGAQNLAVTFFAPLKLLIEIADSGTDTQMIKTTLVNITEDFEKRWMK